jgi:hypothetical protein
MNPNTRPSKGIQRGQPNILRFREIADSVNPSFHRFCEHLARSRQGMHHLSKGHMLNDSFSSRAEQVSGDYGLGYPHGVHPSKVRQVSINF